MMKQQMEGKVVLNQKEFALIQSLVTCSICTDIITDPYQCTKCENSFCKVCIEDWKKKSPDCPFKCAKPEMKSSRTIRVLLSQIKLKCPNGCNAEIAYDEYDKHCNETCSKINFKTEYQSLMKKFKTMKLEMDELKKKNNASMNSFKSMHHTHVLYFNYLNRNAWICNVCKAHFAYGLKGSYLCKPCDFDLCKKCKEKEEMKG